MTGILGNSGGLVVFRAALQLSLQGLRKAVTLLTEYFNVYLHALPAGSEAGTLLMKKTFCLLKVQPLACSSCLANGAHPPLLVCACSTTVAKLLIVCAINFPASTHASSHSLVGTNLSSEKGRSVSSTPPGRKKLTRPSPEGWAVSRVSCQKHQGVKVHPLLLPSSPQEEAGQH